ncbi:putative STOREKEEPER protein [Cocos nucifera]|nr:putative STOREKEEPER protein [Cocos nucifera]
MPDDPSSDPASPSRKSDRKRKARDFFNEEPAGKSSQAGQRRLADDNAVALLRAAIDFRSGTGSIPLPSNMGIFHEFVKASLPTPLSKEQVYNKLRHLRRKFQKSGPVGSGPNDGLVHDLSTEVWGAVDKKDYNKEEKKAKEGTPVAVIKNGDAATVAAEEEEQQQGVEEERGVHGLDSLPYVSSAAAEHWKENGLWGVSWEAGLKRMDPSKARVLEEKWRRQLGDEMKLQMDWSKTSRELLALLNDAYKGMST